MPEGIEDMRLFRAMLGAVMALYGRPLSADVVDIWWAALRRFDIHEVRRAFNAHVQNPEAGQFPPKPADLIRFLDGTGESRALLAWSLVERALRRVGPYQTLIFDDPITQRVLYDMGGWVAFGVIDEDALPFRAREFEKRYQGYALHGGADSHPSRLPGIAEIHNLAHGQPVSIPVLIGDPVQARLVRQQGSDGLALTRWPVGRLSRSAASQGGAV